MVILWVEAWFLGFIIIRCIVGLFSWALNDRLKKTLEDVARNLDNSEKLKKFDAHQEIDKLEFILDKKFRKNIKFFDRIKIILFGQNEFDFSFTTRIIASIEILLFSALAYISLLFSDSSYFSIQALLIIIFGWFGLKIFGSYKQWEGELFGRAYSYNFLLGSILNVFLSTLLGFGLFQLILKLV